MRALRRPGLVALSLVLHGLALASLAPHRRGAPQRPPLTLEIVPLVRSPARAAPAPTEAAAPVVRATAPRSRVVALRPRGEFVTRSASAATPTDDVAAAGRSSPAAETARSPGTIDLFPSGTLALVVGPAGGGSGWGGHTRRAGDGQPAPNDVDAAAEREAAGQRVRRWADEAAGEARTTSGRVPPGWREIEREVGQRFRPDAAVISTKSKTQDVANQVAGAIATPPLGGPTARDHDISAAGHNHDISSLRREQITAAQDHFDRPAGWRRTEIELVVDERGAILEARVVATSGRRELDRQALDAVRRATDARPVRDPRGRVRVRWAVEAAVSINLPRMSPIVDATSNLVRDIIPTMKFTFDEVTGVVKPHVPMSREVHTRVRLLSVAPVDPAQ